MGIGIYMTAPTDQNQIQNVQPTDKELNFRALETKYQRQLEQERAARIEIEKQYQETQKKLMKQDSNDDEDDINEPYVDHKRLNKKFDSFEKRMEERIDKKAEEKARTMLDKEKKDNWVKNNPDFYDVLQQADKFAEANPELAESLLEMPDTFERQKLVYKSVKTFNQQQASRTQQSSIQQKVDANQKSPYYQPSGVGTAPYSTSGDFSASGQKNAYNKMKELQKKLRL
jgi:hypothetical protein